MVRFNKRLLVVAASVALAVSASGVVPVVGADSGVMKSGIQAVRKCTPGYKPCIRLKASDVDCRGGSGNGPRYTKAGVVYRVRGWDRYGLDADNDGWGCER